MSKLSFRARAPDPSKPMPVYTTDELPDLPDFTSSNRAVPQMPTGMEKEEESEHHLQRAISAQQVYGSANHLVIPTPEATECVAYYDELYEANVRQGKQYIHMQPLSMEQDIPDYDMDEEDENWVKKQAQVFDLTPFKFEIMMDRLEKGSGQKVMSVKEAKALLKEDDDLTLAVYDYWLNKRLKVGHALILEVKGEKRDGSTTNNPYVAFRRRTEKMQTRKNRKNDEASYEKMLKLKRDLTKAVTLLEMIKRREKSKREGIHLTIEIFEKRFQMGDFSGQVLRECEELVKKQPSFVPLVNGNQYWNGKEEIIRKKRDYKKRKHKISSEKPRQNSTAPARPDTHVPSHRPSEDDFSPVQSPTDVEEEDPDGLFAFRRKKGCNYHTPQPEMVCGWPWSSDESAKSMQDKRYRYCCTSLRVPRRCVGFARRRIGRGGRVLLDRAYTPFNDDFRDFERHMLNFPQDEESPLPHRTEEEDEKTLFRPVHKQLSLPLNHILEEIKAKRMPHFRPKTPPPDQEISRLPLLPPADPIFLEDPFFVTMEGEATQEMLSESLLNSQGLQPIVQRIDNSQDSQDSQMIEVDVVGHDTPQTPVSFISAMRPMAINSMDGSKPTDVTQNLDMRTASDALPLGRNGTVIGNHIGGLPPEDSLASKVPEGHSTAPADTVLELNYPLPSTKTVVVTENLLQDGLTVKTDSSKSDMKVSVQLPDQSVAKTLSGTVNTPMNKNTPISIENVDVKTSNNVVKVETVKKLSQNNLQALQGRENHDENSTISHLGNNQALPRMEVT